jgi:hypothetical protein
MEIQPSSIIVPVGYEDLAIPTFPVEIEYLPALSSGNLPTGMLFVLISCTAGINPFRAPQKIPAGCFPAPKILHFCSRPRVWCLQGNPFCLSVDHALWNSARLVACWPISQ